MTENNYTPDQNTANTGMPYSPAPESAALPQPQVAPSATTQPTLAPYPADSAAPYAPNPSPTQNTAAPQSPAFYSPNPYAPNPYGYAPTPYAYPVPYVAPKTTNGWAIAGFICSFLSPLLAFIFSGIGLNKASKLGGKGKNLAIAGIVIAAINMVLSIILSATGALDSLYSVIQLG